MSRIINPADIIHAVLNEPDLPGAIPHELYQQMCSSQQAAEEVMRAAVKQTKDNILRRLRMVNDIPEMSAETLAIITASCEAVRQVYERTITIEYAMSRSRDWDAATVRMISMVIMRKYACYGLKKIGQVMGRDHSSVCGALKRAADLAVDKRFVAALELAEQLCGYTKKQDAHALHA